MNAVRLLIPTESHQEYEQHVDEWLTSLTPSTPAEYQLVLLLADAAWRLRRIGRIEERRALEVLENLVEQGAEWKANAQAQELTVALDHVDAIIRSIPLPVPTAVLMGFITGLNAMDLLFSDLREALQPELWPDNEVVAYQAARKLLTDKSDEEELICEPLVAVGRAVAGLAGALRALKPRLQADLEKARIHLATVNLLVDQQGAQLQRHRRLLEESMSRQFDMLTKVRSVSQVSGSLGSFDRPHLELRVIEG